MTRITPIKLAELALVSLVLVACDEPPPAPDAPAESAPPQEASADASAAKTADNPAGGAHESKLEDWVACGTGRSTASVVACGIARDWNRAQPSLPAREDEGPLLFGSCRAVAKGARSAAKRWMLARHTKEGFTAQLLEPADHTQRRTFEKATHGTDTGIGGPNAEANEEILRSVAPKAELTKLDGAHVRMHGDQALIVERGVDGPKIRFCRLVPLR